MIDPAIALILDAVESVIDPPKLWTEGLNATFHPDGRLAFVRQRAGNSTPDGIQIELQMQQLSAFLMSEPDILAAITPTFHTDIELHVEAGCIALRHEHNAAKLFDPTVFLGARHLPNVARDPLTPGMQEIFGDLVSGMLPGDHVLVWDDTSMHTRMQCLHQVPGVQAFADDVYSSIHQALFPLYLIRFETIALVMDKSVQIAWMAVKD